MGLNINFVNLTVDLLEREGFRPVHAGVRRPTVSNAAFLRGAKNKEGIRWRA